MERSEMRMQDALARCRLPAEQAWCLPPECYAGTAFAETESRAIFSGWVGLGRADMVQKPGDFITLDFARHSIILLRDLDGGLRAFANTCRHRGARLMEGHGECRGIKCPFHAWAYRLDGSLAAAPHMDAARGFDKADHGLHAYQAEERMGFAFVNLGDGTVDLDNYLGDFTQKHTPWPLDRLVTTRRAELKVNCNWKVFLEVFNEYYHLPFVHPDTVNALYAEPDAGDETTGAYASQFGRTEGTGGLLQNQQDKALPAIPGLEGEAATGARYTWVFPNMTFAANTDALWVYEAYPLGPNQCQVVQSACFPPETLALPEADTKIAAYHDRLDAALDEDIGALVNQQRGLASPMAKQGRFQPKLESNVAGFARWYAEQLCS